MTWAEVPGIVKREWMASARAAMPPPKPIVYDSVIHLMEAQGGSFVRAIAHAYLMADAVNRVRLRDAFLDYFTTYEKRFAEMQKDPT